jgi:hypothetical protein
MVRGQVVERDANVARKRIDELGPVGFLAGRGDEDGEFERQIEAANFKTRPGSIRGNKASGPTTSVGIF